MKFIVDAFGGDNAPLDILKGTAMMLAETPDLEVILTGDEGKIRQVAQEEKISLERMTIVHAPDVITMDEQATDIMRGKKNSSMSVGLQLLAKGEGDAFVSAGSTGALVVGGTLIVKRLKGIRRAALAPLIPNDAGQFMLIDSGANVECKADYLQQFGIMGSVYMKNVMNLENPRVALANVGTEDTKGGELQQEAFRLLQQAPVNFVGNVEGREIPRNGADVVVADGFTGNLILKVYEGVALAMMKNLKNVFYSSLKNKIGALLLKKGLYDFKKRMDYNEYGGAPLLGLTKPVFKAHGSSTAKTFCSAMKITYRFVEKNVIGQISAALTELQNSSEE